jgi:predicted HicB family RNase H-like nuclease
MQLRLPPELHALLVASASRADRSLNGEIVNRLRSTFTAKRNSQTGTQKVQP